ncbi:hypothetical protein BDV25DRAFT_19552 [Aspergillus avenaceus]|uniref:Uncharacterized protein n=1 Tax=Aspergillus avenaceus TaxID=36643 RepID=A0A5N6TPZ8_ASPAV|nr:hypothetical protein BDV25DRAFT_19552 [Aspergillus avenaceus]
MRLRQFLTVLTVILLQVLGSPPEGNTADGLSDVTGSSQGRPRLPPLPEPKPTEPFEYNLADVTGPFQRRPGLPSPLEPKVAGPGNPLKDQKDKEVQGPYQVTDSNKLPPMKAPASKPPPGPNPKAGPDPKNLAKFPQGTVHSRRMEGTCLNVDIKGSICKVGYGRERLTTPCEIKFPCGKGPYRGCLVDFYKVPNEHIPRRLATCGSTRPRVTYGNLDYYESLPLVDTYKGSCSDNVCLLREEGRGKLPRRKSACHEGRCERSGPNNKCHFEIRKFTDKWKADHEVYKAVCGLSSTI